MVEIDSFLCLLKHIILYQRLEGVREGNHISLGGAHCIIRSDVGLQMNVGALVMGSLHSLSYGLHKTIKFLVGQLSVKDAVPGCPGCPRMQSYLFLLYLVWFGPHKYF